jgi:hypothetical protein
VPNNLYGVTKIRFELGAENPTLFLAETLIR